MLCSLLLLTLSPAVAAPVPKPPPPVIEVTAKRYFYPPRIVLNGGVFIPIQVDDGLFVEVTIKNVSLDPITFDTRHEFGDLVYVKVADAKGAEVSAFGQHLLLLCSSTSKKTELKAGDSVKVIAHLRQDMLFEKRTPGKYTGRVVFAAGKIRAESPATFDFDLVNE